MLIRNEADIDASTICRVVTEAMKLLPQSTGTEAAIVERLRAENALSLSIVAEEEGKVVGYLAASRALIGSAEGWGLIGPVAVQPSRHYQGIGSALMAEAIVRLRESCIGAVLVGDPGYYGRFGFQAYPGLWLANCPQKYVQALPFTSSEPRGELLHHPAFG